MELLTEPSRKLRDMNDDMITSRRQPRETNVDGITMPEVPEAAVKDLVKVFKLLSDEMRMRILLFLTRTPELHVRALCEMLDQSQPAVSHHLALLKAEELIELRRSGKHNFYHLVPHRFQEMLNTLFADVPPEMRRIRFEDYELSYSPGDAT